MFIRPASPADAGAIFEIETLQPDAALWSEEAIKKEMQNPACALLAAVTDEGRVAGFISARHSFETAEILNLALRPEAERKGTGTALLRALLKTLKAAGAENVTLEVNEKNEKAVKFYLSQGFKTVNIRKKFYRGKDDALLMGLKI
jgi:ribosomal-protein-alanine N-acetyltransferase